MIILLVGLMTTGCLNRPPKIGLLIHDNNNPCLKNDEKSLVEAVIQLKGRPVVRKAGNDCNLQIKQAEELIKMKVGVLVVMPVDQLAAAKIVALAHDNEIKVIAYDDMIKDCPLDYYVSADQLKVGEMQARYITKRQPKGNYALIGGPPSEINSLTLYFGQMNILNPLEESGDINLVFKEFAKEWSVNEGYRLAIKALNSTENELNAILCGDDEIALGVIKALKERGLAGRVAVAEQDADPHNIREIFAGNQTVTVANEVESLARTAAGLAMRVARNEKIGDRQVRINNGHKLVPAFFVDPVQVNEGNIKVAVASDSHQQDKKPPKNLLRVLW
jgi:D-xylose transport system substrate-binding protein